MRIGFLGTGAITTAIVTGLCTTDNPPKEIWVSPRNREKATNLETTFTPVHVGKSNQEVLEHADMVVLAILPQQKEEILGPLTFRADQTVIHLLAGTPIQEIVPLVAPATDIVRAVPLPCTAIHQGPIAVYPDHERANGFFSLLGTVVPTDQEAQLETLSVITALMAPYYALVEQVVAWAADEGIQREKAAVYTASMFGALSTIAASFPGGRIQSLVSDSMTPGGLNELAMATINDQNGFESLTAALEKVKQKIS